MSKRRQKAARAFGQALRDARRAKGVSQEQLAEGADIDRTTPSLYERGLRTPSLAVLIDIGRALDVEPTQLVSDTLEKLLRDARPHAKNENRANDVAQKLHRGYEDEIGLWRKERGTS